MELAGRGAHSPGTNLGSRLGVEASRHLERALELDPEHQIATFSLIRCALVDGAAVATLRRVVEVRNAGRVRSMQTDRLYDPIRDRPDFQALLEDLGLAD